MWPMKMILILIAASLPWLRQVSPPGEERPGPLPALPRLQQLLLQAAVPAQGPRGGGALRAVSATVHAGLTSGTRVLNLTK